MNVHCQRVVNISPEVRLNIAIPGWRADPALNCRAPLFPTPWRPPSKHLASVRISLHRRPPRLYPVLELPANPCPVLVQQMLNTRSAFHEPIKTHVAGTEQCLLSEALSLQLPFLPPVPPLTLLFSSPLLTLYRTISNGTYSTYGSDSPPPSCPSPLPSPLPLALRF